MGESELKTSLQREGEARISSFWQDAEECVSERRKQITAELKRLHAETDSQLQSEVSQLRNNMLFSSQARAMECRLHAEAALEERLRRLADQLLPELAGADQSMVWEALCAELPTADWSLLTVSPADRERASRAFPTATVEYDEALGGGLIVTSADGMIRIDNSLSCRLMRAWPDLLPKLLGAIRKRVDNDETAHANTIS